MPLTSIAETYVPCVGAIVTVGTTVIGDVMDGGYSIEYGVDDMTNNSGGGDYDDVKTIRKTTGTLKVAWPAAGGPGLAVGTKYALIIDLGGTGATAPPYLSGNCRINKADLPTLDVHKGVVCTFSFTMVGAINTTHP